MKNQQNPFNGYAPFTMGKPQEGAPVMPQMPYMFGPLAAPNACAAQTPQMPYAFAPKAGEQPAAPATPQMPYVFAPAAAAGEEEK